VAIGEKLSPQEITFFSESLEELSCWIGASPFEGFDLEERRRVGVYCSM
jgi:hypothetical protein